MINYLQHKIPQNIALCARPSREMRAWESWPHFGESPSLVYGNGFDSRLIFPEVTRNQQSDPGCIGEAIGFAFSRPDYVVSGRGIWIGARIIDRDLGDPDIGTSLDSALKAVLTMGLPPFHEDEHDPTSDNHAIDTCGLSLADQMQAQDHKPKFIVNRIDTFSPTNVFWSVSNALRDPETRIVFTSGLRPSYLSKGRGSVATGADIGGGALLHAQAIIGVDIEQRQLLVSNSWGEEWGGLEVGSRFVPGAIRFDLGALSGISEIRVIRRLAT